MRVDADGRPRAVVVRARSAAVAVDDIQEVWRIDEGWWRPPMVSRLYFRLALVDGRRVTVYRDLLDGTWWSQRA